MRFKSTVKNFIYETFRPRSRADYAEVFSRGNGGGESVPYPWLYSRALLLLFFLFSVISLSFYLSGLNFIAVAFAGGAFADAVFIILLYELYPKRDFLFATPFVVFVLGGILSSAIAYFLYSFMNVEAPYLMQAWTAFVEEFAKSATVVAVILAVKKKNPYICIVLGTAVGGGFSALENMWYAYTEGFAVYSVAKATQTLLIRSFGTPFSHAVWAGIFGWALSAEKPYKKWQTYALLVFNYVMHFFVNFPLMEQFEGWKGYPISAFTGVASVTLFVFLLVKSRKAFIVKEENSERKIMHKRERLPKINVADEKAFTGFSSAKKIVQNAVGALAVILLSFALLGSPLLFRGYSAYTYVDYDNFEDCKSVAQNGLEFQPDFERKYVKLADITQNWQVAYSAGDLSYVVQRERSGDYVYRYRYSYRYYAFFQRDDEFYYVRYNGEYVKAYNRTENKAVNGFEEVYKKKEDGGEMPELESLRRMELQSVMVESEGGIYYDTPVYDGATTLHLFILNPKCFSVYVSGEGKYRAVMDEKEPLGKTEAAIFSAVFAVLAAGAGIAYLTLKITSGRYKDVE